VDAAFGSNSFNFCTKLLTEADGQQVQAYYTSDFTQGAREFLDVKSKDFVQSLEKDKADKLKAENAL